MVCECVFSILINNEHKRLTLLLKMPLLTMCPRGFLAAGTVAYHIVDGVGARGSLVADRAAEAAS